MYIIHNAMRNLARNKGRNIMMGVIILAIILTTVVSLTINNTAGAVIESYKERFSSEASITPDMEKIMQAAQNNANGGMVRIMQPQISSELLLKFTESEFLKGSLATGSVTANSDDIEAIDQQEEDESDASQDTTGPSFQMGGGGAVSMRLGGRGNYTLQGDIWTDFDEGMRSLQDGGRFPENDNECLISTDLAVLNGLQVGDTVSFTATMSRDYDLEEYPDLAEGDTIILDGVEYIAAESFMGGRATREVVYSLTITGLYIDLHDEYPIENMSGIAVLNRRNEVLTTLPTLLAHRQAEETGINVDVKYYLKNPDLLDEFEADVRAMGLSDQYLVSTDVNSYDRIVKPVVGLKGVSLTFMIVVLVLGVIILLLLSSISIRERKYEIGVLRAMGMKKSKVSLGLCVEMLAITCVCLIFGIGIGTVAAQPVSDMLLEQQIAAEEQNEQAPGGFPGGSGGFRMSGTGPSGSFISSSGSSNAQPLSEMDLSVGFLTILEIIGIALLLAMAASVLSISRITKYEPIKILMERN